jgi:hypothetical protein
VNAVRVALLAAAGLCAGCALWRPAPPPDFPLLPPASLGHSLQLEQILHAAHGTRSFTLQSFVSITPERIAVSGFTALGQPVFVVEYDGRDLRAESAGPETLPPQRLLADLQLALWPLPALQAAAAAAGSAWQITEPAPGTRRVRHGDELLAEIHYAGAARGGSRMWLVNFAHRYSLIIEPRPPTP